MTKRLLILLFILPALALAQTSTPTPTPTPMARVPLPSGYFKNVYLNSDSNATSGVITEAKVAAWDSGTAATPTPFAGGIIAGATTITAPLVVQSSTVDSASGTNIVATFRSFSDPTTYSRVRFWGGLTTDTKLYLTWLNYSGGSERWFLGKDQLDAFILYSNGSPTANAGGHRLYIRSGNAGASNFDINAAINGSVDINNESYSGSNGVRIYSGGETPALVYDFDPTLLSVTPNARFAGGINGGTATDAGAGQISITTTTALVGTFQGSNNAYLNIQNTGATYVLKLQAQASSAAVIGSSTNNNVNLIANNAAVMVLKPSDGAYIPGVLYTTGTSTFVGNAYFNNNVSALSFTDRTPFDSETTTQALAAVAGIKAGADGMLDHTSLPAFARKQVRRIEEREIANGTEPLSVGGAVEAIDETTREKTLEDGTTTTVRVQRVHRVEDGRDLGAMITVQGLAIKHLRNQVQELRQEARDDRQNFRQLKQQFQDYVAAHP